MRLARWRLVSPYPLALRAMHYRHGRKAGGEGGLLALRPTRPKKILTQNVAEGKSRLNKRPLCGTPPLPLCHMPSGCCLFTGPWTVTRSSLRMLRRVAAFCRPLRPVLPLVSFPRSRSPVVGVPGLCWMWRDVPFARQRCPVVGVLGVVWGTPQTPPPLTY